MTDDTELIDLARDLHDRGRIPGALYRVYCLHRYGLTFRQIQNRLLTEQIAELETRPPSYNENLGKIAPKEFDEGRVRGHSLMTLWRWYQRVQAIVEKEQDRRKEGLPRLGVTGERGGDPFWYKDRVVTEVLKKTG